MESIGYTRTFIGQRRGSPTATNAAPRTSLTLQPRRGTRTPTAARRGTRPLTVAAISSHRRTPIAGQDQVHLPFASIPKVPIPPPSRDTILLVCLLVLLGANIASSRQIRNLPKKKLLDQLLIIGGFFGLVSGGLLFDIAVVSKMLLLMSVMVMMEKETHDD